MTSSASISIEEICRSKFFHNNIYLMAGRNGINKRVSQVSVMEVEDFVNFDLGENLLVLTTFSFCKNDEDKMFQIIKKLINKSITGIIVKLNRYIDFLSSEIIDLANENDFPLFIIDNDIPFREIINHVFQSIIHKQYDTIYQMNNMYKQLYSSLITDVSIEQYIKQLEIPIEIEFYIESLEGIIYTSPTLVGNTESSLYDYDESDGHNISNRISYEDYYEVVYKNNKILVFPIRTSSTLFGQIVLFSSNEELSIVERMAFTQLASYLSIKLNERRMSQEERLNNNGRIYNELVSGNTITEEKAENLLTSAGFKLNETYQVIYISLLDPNFSYERLSKVKSKYASVFYDESAHRFIGYSATGFRIIYGLDINRPATESLFNNFVRELRQIFESEKISYKMGISNKFDKLQQLAVANYQAKNTILISRKIPGYESAFKYNDIWEIDMISGVLNSLQSRELYEKVIQPLEEHDACHQIKLFETLEAVVLMDTLKDVSETLFIHITTLRYRLDKIKALTNCDFQTNRGKFILTMAYFVYALKD